MRYKNTLCPPEPRDTSHDELSAQNTGRKAETENTHTAQANQQHSRSFGLTSLEGAADVMAALKRKLKKRTTMNLAVEEAHIGIHEHLSASHLHTHERVLVHLRCAVLLLRTHTVSPKVQTIHQSVPAEAGTYQKLPLFLLLQAAFEGGGAELIVLPPAEGGRDVELAGCTFRIPRYT